MAAAPGDELARAAEDETLAAPVREFLRGGGRLERILLDEEGRFTHEGDPIENERLRALFHRSVDRTPGGTWILRIPPFVYPIAVADTPYHVRSLRLAGDEADGAGGAPVWLRLSDDTEEPLDPATLAYDARRGLSCAVKGGRFRARLCRPAFHALCDRLEEEEATGGGLWLRLPGGRRWAVARE